MSAKQSTGSCLERTPMIPVDFCLQPLLLNRLGKEINRPAKQRSEASLQRSQFEQPDLSGGIEFGCQIDIAVRVILAARSRAE